MGELPTRLIIPMLIEEIKFNRIPSRKIRERGPRAREKNNSKSYNSVAIPRDRSALLAATVDTSLLRNNCRR